MTKSVRCAWLACAFGCVVAFGCGTDEAPVPEAAITKVAIELPGGQTRAFNGTPPLALSPIGDRLKAITMTISPAVTSAEERASVERQVSVAHGAEALEGAFRDWASDGSSVRFAPLHRLEPAGTYRLVVRDTESLKLRSEVPEAEFTVALPDDINGDGYSDLVVGAPAYTSPVEAGVGHVYVFFGSAAGVPSRDLAVPGQARSNTLTDSGANGLGISVSSNGDVNGDGYADVVVGSWRWGGARGRAYVFLGSSTGIGTCDLGTRVDCARLSATLTGAGADDMLGMSVAMAGDLDADGFDEIVLSALNAPGGASNGQVYVVRGASGGPSDCDLGASGGCPGLMATVTGKSPGDLNGYQVATAGDVNADGYDDIVAGAMNAPCCDYAPSAPGQAYVLLGSPTGVDECDMSHGCVPTTTLTGRIAGDALGGSVAAAGDLNADGYSDLLVGARAAPSDGFHAGPGEAYVFLGGEHGVPSCDLSGGCTPASTVTGESNGNLLGQALSGAGDVDSDGFDDWLTGSLVTGRVHLFRGGPSLSDCNLGQGCSSAAVLQGPGDYVTADKTDWFGFSLAGGADYNRDGHVDLAVGARDAETGTDEGRGAAFLFMGSAEGQANCNLGGAGCPQLGGTFQGAGPGDHFGSVD